MESEPPARNVSLLAGSTVWPHLMVLLLRAEGGGLTVLPILRDSVTAQQFRALAVAVRAGEPGSAVADAASSTSGVPGSGAPYRPITGT